MTEIRALIPTGQAGTPAPLTHRAAKAIAAAKATAARQTPAVSEEALDRALRENVPELRATANARLELHIDQASHRVVGRIVDRATGELIRQLPSEEMLSLIAKTKEMLGSLYDASV